MNTIDSEIVDAIKCMVAYQVERARKRDPNWERALRNLVEELAQHKEDAKRLYDDMKATGLTAGTIEAEGYLRAMLLANDTAAGWLAWAETNDDE